MNRAGLLALCAYGKYANHLLLDAVAKLPSDRLDHKVCPSHGTVRLLLQHMFAGEAAYLAICQGQPFTVTPGQVQAVPALRHNWLIVEEYRGEYLASLDERGLHSLQVVRINNRQLKLAPWQMIVQSIVHSIHHRGELSVVLSDMGHPLPDLDGIIHFDDLSGEE